ncbi:MAG: hypothetical protein SWH61_06540 [Thermodesulfobacteriota bacterium]|nr:hypothetical protein [Thermodesulfobacteriota bacterium]
MKHQTVHPANPLPQDLHIHTTYSSTDNMVVPEQTLGLIAEISHARTIGISDHFEAIGDLDGYANDVRAHGFYLGTEIDGPDYVADALQFPADYYVYHCYDTPESYRALAQLAADGRPVIVAHPHVMNTDLKQVPETCLIEINNRYISRAPGRGYYKPYVDRFDFVISSDAHQPNWLNQVVARQVAASMEIRETLLF